MKYVIAVLWKFLIVMVITQSLLSQEKVDTAAMRKSKSIHEVEWEKHEKMQSEKSSQFQWAPLQIDRDPFNLQRNMRYYLPINCNVTLGVFDIWGTKIRTLVQGSISQGEHQFIWNCRNDSDQLVPNGIYIVIFHAAPENSTNSHQEAEKILVIQ